MFKASSHRARFDRTVIEASILLGIVLCGCNTHRSATYSRHFNEMRETARGLRTSLNQNPIVLRDAQDKPMRMQVALMRVGAILLSDPALDANEVRRADQLKALYFNLGAFGVRSLQARAGNDQDELKFWLAIFEQGWRNAEAGYHNDWDAVQPQNLNDLDKLADTAAREQLRNDKKSSAPPTLPAQGRVERRLTTVNAYIVEHAQKDECQESMDARRVVTGDLDHDGVPETVAVYVLAGCGGGGNNWKEHLAVFVQSHEGLEPFAAVQVGGGGTRAVDLAGVVDGAVKFTTLAYAVNDPSCCPTKKGHSTYALVGRNLKETAAGM